MSSVLAIVKYLLGLKTKFPSSLSQFERVISRIYPEHFLRDLICGIRYQIHSLEEVSVRGGGRWGEVSAFLLVKLDLRLHTSKLV